MLSISDNRKDIVIATTLTTKLHIVIFKPWKQPLSEMQGKVAYNRPLWSGCTLVSLEL